MRCKCSMCNAPEYPPHCFDCGHEFKEGEEEFEDAAKNPVCWKCKEKLIDKADALRKMWAEEGVKEWERREQSRRVDAEYVARRMPYEENKRGWWEK